MTDNNLAGKPDYYMYEMVGLKIRSCLPLPAPACDINEVPDVIVSYGKVPRELENSTDQGPLYQASPDEFLFCMENEARFLVRNGRDITIEPESCTDESGLRLILLSSPFAALVHQRELLALHASAVEFGNDAVLFMGETGTGKSTLAAYLSQHGYPMLADDISVVDFVNNASVVWPGWRRMKLCPDALKAMGIPRDGLSRVHPDANKYEFIPEFIGKTPRRIKAIYLIEVSEDKQPFLQPLLGLDKIVSLAGNTYRRRFIYSMGRMAGHHQRCALLAKNIPVFRLYRSRDHFQLSQIARSLGFQSAA